MYLYKIFKKFKVIATIYVCIMYPYYANSQFGIPAIGTVSFYLLSFMECILLTDFILNHILQQVQEDGKWMNLPVDVISKNYFHGRFLFDLIALIPFGLLEQMD